MTPAEQPVNSLDEWRALSPEVREFYLYQKVCCVNDHERRLSRLETWAGPVIAAAGAVGAVAYAKAKDWFGF